MKTNMQSHPLTTMAQREEVLPGTQPVTFAVLSMKDECYQWIHATLIKSLPLWNDDDVLLEASIDPAGHGPVETRR